MDSVLGALGLTTRTVSATDLGGRPAWRAVLARTYPTDTADLWDALTDPERIPRWFLPVSGDLRAGGSYQFEGNAGGTIEECEPPRRLRVTWAYGDAEPTWVTLRLLPAGDGTTLELEHLGAVPQDMWQRYGPGATGVGWDLALRGLSLHLATREQVDPARFMAWTASPEGAAFVRESARAWGEADAAGGATPEQAQQRARRTVAFYTGTPEDPDSAG